MTKLWNIIWHNEPFHWAIAFVLIVAIIVELCTLWQYCGTDGAAIKFLSNSKFKKGKNVKLSNEVSNWLKKYLGTDDRNKISQQAQKDGNFVLIKYPSVLAHPIPRSSLRFVTTLCTAIGLLGTFYGIQQGLQGMTAQRSAFEVSAVQAATTFGGIREELQKVLQERAAVEKQMLQATQTGIIQILAQANTTFHEQTNTLQTVGNQASGLMNDAKDNLLATLVNIDATLIATRHTVEDDLTRFRKEYQTNLQTFFEQQNYLLDGTLGKQQKGLSGVVNNLDRVFREEFERRSILTQEVDGSITKIQKSVEEINKLVIAAGLNDSQRLIQLANLTTDIAKQVNIVDNSYKNLNEKFDNSLQSWQSHLEVSMQRTVDLQVSFFEQADNSMARVCGNVLKTAEVLLEANKKY